MARDILAWANRDVSKPPPLLKYRSSKVFIMSTLCIAVFTDIFLYGVIVPIIPFALTTRVGVAEEDVQHWVSVLLAVYGAAIVCASPICGWFADKTKSRRLPLLLGLLALCSATLILCLGTSIAVLAVGRLLQGISAAVVGTVGLALLVDTVGPAEIAQAMGYVSLSMTLAFLIAPLLGGVVYNTGGYYCVYYMSFGMIILDIILRTLLVEKKVAKQWAVAEEPATRELPRNIPVSSHAAAISDPEIASIHPAAIPVSVIQRPSPQPKILPSYPKRHLPPILSLLASTRLWSALYLSLIQSVLMTAWDATLPLRVAHLFNWTSLGAGLIFLAIALPSFLAPVVGKLVDGHGPRVPVTLGLLLSTPAVVLLLLVDHGGVRQIVLLCGLLALLGLALTTAMVPILAEITYVVASEEKRQPGAFGAGGVYAQAYGFYNCAFAGGMLLGPLWGGLVAQTAGWGTMCWSLGLLSAVSVVPAVLWTGGWVFDGKRWEGRKGRGRGIGGDQVGRG